MRSSFPTAPRGGSESGIREFNRLLAQDPDFGEALARRAGWLELAKATINEYAASQDDPFAIRHSLQVTSFGGSGTTALSRHLFDAGLDLPKSPDQWPFKHARVPPVPEDVPKRYRVVYVYADPRDAVLSLFRRGLQLGHYWLFHQRDATAEVAQRLRSLDSYLRAGIDDFQLEQHLENWLAHPSGYPVLFLRFDSLPGSWSAVREFVGLPSDYRCMPIRERRSPLSTIDDRTASQLTSMYAGVLERLESLPPVHLVE